MNALLWIALLLFRPADTLRPVHLSGYAQGTTYHITYYAPDDAVGMGKIDEAVGMGKIDSAVRKGQIDSILDKIDSSLSLYKAYSLICQFNRSGDRIRMDEHLAAVIRKSLDTYRRTGGLFDITVQPLVEAWGFSAHHPDQYPDSARIRELLTCTGSALLSTGNGYLLKAKPCIRIDPDGIAQGYSVDVLADFLERNDISNYLVELGGELRVKGRRQPSGERMRIGIEAPNENDFETAAIQKILYIDSGAITTSGSYRAWHEKGGKKFSHTIDPRTGYPVDNELISVTVYAKNAITADAYDNVLMIMGLEKAKKFVESRHDIAAYFIYRRKDGSIATATTSSFNSLFQP